MKKLPEKCDERMPYYARNIDCDSMDCINVAPTCIKCIEKYMSKYHKQGKQQHRTHRK